MHVGLSYTELPVAVSSAFMLFSIQFNTDGQCSLMEEPMYSHACWLV